MDVAASVTGNILTKLVDIAIPHACYPFHFNKYVKELETEKDNLQSKIQEVLDRAKDVRKNSHKVVGKVEKWMDAADSLMAKVVELQEKTKKRNKMPCLKRCPNLISRYNLAKQLQEKLNEIRKHNEVEFSEFSRLTSLVGMDYFSSQDFVAFDSRKGAYEDLLSVIKDDKIHMIGLCGMGGSGKTTLVKEVGKEVEKFFDRVVFVVLSNTIDVRKLQSEIASQLKLEFKEEETQGRARRLSMRLSSGERFLIILDYIWKKLNFEDIGIPTANNQMGCTTLITTRKFDDIAQKIIKECCGLPIAIAAVASTLKDRPYDDWVDALKTLGDPQWVDIEEGLRKDSEIEIDLLAIIGLGLGLAGEIPSYWARIKVMNKAIKKLIDSCLLLKVHGEDGSHCIKMHDLVRDVALWIAKKENKLIMGQLKEDMIMEDHAAKTLSLRGILSSCKNIIPDLWQKIGGGMNELTLLELLESDGIECVIGYVANPSQVGFISNLTRLALSKLKNLKTLNSGELPQGLFANLEELDIKNCDSLEQVLTEDEKEIVDGSEYQSYENAFPKLKRLIISDCKKLEYLMPISFAKSLTHLEHLYVAGSDELRSVFGQSLYEGLNLNRPQMIEFSALEYLQLRKMPNIISICPENYHLTWPSLKLLDSYQCPRLNIKFTNYRVGYGGLRQEDDQMISEDQSKVVVAFQETLQRLHVSHNDEAECGNLKEVFPSFILKDLPQLRELHIEGCDELEKIIEEDDQNVSTSPQLVFPRLVSIMIKYCHKLKSVFPKISTCGVIPNLKALSIEDAPVLDQVFGDDTTHTYQDVTPALKYVVLWKLPSLTSIAPSIAFQNVTHIVALECPKLSLTSSITPLEMLDELTKGTS
ncbi:probable disease resistance protein At4g27220 [Neltuma alba]|uniref:probable disease resistance protein At4g27220 n=1 Tax=Neltuma alba TaxID=207710 RepID=UPI0010A5165E|nr:probable disease resistance protein At4g27220 [Prosopis alba]